MNSACRMMNDELSVFGKMYALYLIIALFVCLAILWVMVRVEQIGDCFAAKRKSAARNPAESGRGNDLAARDTEIK